MAWRAGSGTLGGMIPLLAAVAVGVVALWPRLRAAVTDATPDQAWDHFLVESGLRPVPVTMPDVQRVTELADVPLTLLDRAALGRTDGHLAMVAPLANDRVLVAVRRPGPTATAPGLVVRGGWVAQVMPGPPAEAWSTTAARATVASGAPSGPGPPPEA